MYQNNDLSNQLQLMIRKAIRSIASAKRDFEEGDAALVFQHVAGLIQLEEDQIQRGDVDGVPGLTGNDATQILKKVVRLIEW